VAGVFLLAALPCLGGSGCESNARITVSPPTWAAADADALALLAARPRESCGASPAKLSASFLLLSSRGLPMIEGDEIKVSAGATRRLLLAPQGGADAVWPEVGLRDLRWKPRAGGAATDAAGQVTASRIEFRAAGQPLALGLCFDNSDSMAAADAKDERVVAGSELVRGFLCSETASSSADCPFSPLDRVWFYRLGGGRVDERLPGVRSLDDLGTELERLPQTEGGLAPLRDGLGAATHAVRNGAAAMGGGAGTALILVAASTGDTISSASLEQTVSALAAQPAGPLFVIGLADASELRRLACETRGAFLPASSAAELSGLLRRARQGLRGQWQADFELPLVPPDVTEKSYELEGTIEVAMGGVTHAVAFRTPVDSR
jgi:hypothetical protein